MENNLPQKIEARLAELPEYVREAILSEDTGAQIREIGSRYQLHIDQAATLEDTATLVMLGFIPQEKFSDELQKQLLISKEEAEKIIADIDTRIFLPIRETMKRSDEPVLVKTPEAVPVAPTPPPVTAPSMPVAEKMLTEKTAVIPAPAANVAAPKPIYKADPYREPIE